MNQIQLSEALGSTPDIRGVRNDAGIRVKVSMNQSVDLEKIG